MKNFKQRSFSGKTLTVLGMTIGVIVLPVTIPIILGEMLFKAYKFKAVPSKGMNGDFNEILSKLEKGEKITQEDWAVTEKMVIGVNNRFGSSTFNFQTALRVLLTAKEKRENGAEDAGRWQVPAEYEVKIKQAFTGYRFFMTMPGKDNMVLWSENLQIQLASSEYFTALLWPEAVFTVDGKSADEHMAHAESRINIWLEQRWKYGFSEWNSPTYYVEDISPLCLIIDFAHSEEMRTRAKIILDLLLYDLAIGQFDGIFSSTAGRAYENGRRLTSLDHYDGNGALKIYNSVGTVINEMAGDAIYSGLSNSGKIKFEVGSSNKMLNNFRFRKSGNYDIPEVFKKIAPDKNYRVLKASYGLMLAELEAKGLIGQADNQIMMQWAMESFSNPETIENTLAYCRNNKLYNNGNFKELRFFDLTVLRFSGLISTVTKWLNPFSNGIVLQRANFYTYKTPYYLQATAQRYCPNTHGNQQHLWTVNFGEFAVFASNPLAECGKRSFWLSDGVTPTVAQDENITMSIYDTGIRGMKIRKVYRYTHAHFPISLFERAEEERIDEGMIFGEKDGAFIALLSNGPIKFTNESGTEDTSFTRTNLVSEGAVTYWICETGDESKEGFDSFVARISSNCRTFENNTLCYSSNGKSYSLVNKGEFCVDNKKISLEYDRYDSDYIKAERETGTMKFHCNGSSLYLDFNHAIRTMQES